MIEAFEIADADRLLERAGALPERAPALRYLAEFLRAGPRALIDTQDLPRLVLEVESEFVPVVINDDDEALCYFLSPQVHYVAYMQDELAKIHDNRAARLMSAAVGILGRCVAPLGFNRCVSVNNWLFTTSPTLELSAAGLAAITTLLSRRFPSLPLVFRGIDVRAPDTRRMFEQAGYLLVINRPVFEYDPAKIAARSARRRRYIDRELKLLDDPRFVVRFDDRLAPNEELRIAQLYRSLYLEKHSRYNARYTPAYFRVAIDCGVERLVTLRDHGGEILAFGTLRRERRRLVLALVGYDFEQQQAGLPLYRALIAAGLRVSTSERLLCFLSTGNAEFKRRRGGVEWLEYEGVYQRHLRPARRIPWQLFKATLERAVADLDTSQI